MSTIVKSKSNICNNRIAGGDPSGPPSGIAYVAEVDTELSEHDGRITAQIKILFIMTTVSLKCMRSMWRGHRWEERGPLTRPSLNPHGQ
jgi:hypothetical protein